MIITGKAYWPKVLKPVADYNKTGEEYTIDVTVDAETRAQLTEAGLAHKIKPAVSSKGREHASKMEYIKLVMPTKNPRTGEAFNPPRVKDKFGQDWDKDKLIGNDSLVDVMFDIREGTLANGDKWRKPSLRGVRVVEHVPVEPKEEFEYDEPTSEEVWD